MDVQTDDVSQYQGDESWKKQLKVNFFDRFVAWGKKAKSQIRKRADKVSGRYHDPNFSAVDSRDVKLHLLSQAVQMNGTEEAHKELMAEVQHRMRSDAVFKTVFPDHVEEELVEQPTDFDCLRYLVNAHDSSCTPFEDYSLKHVKHLVHQCETGTPDEISDAALRLVKACTTPDI